MAVIGSEDFEAGTGSDPDVLTPTGSLVWTGTNNHDGGAWAVVAGVGFGGTNGAVFQYGPDAAGEDTSTELQFQIDPTWPDFLISFRLFVPENYQHRNDPPNNNKLLALWHSDYANSGSEPHVVIETLPGDSADDSRIRIGSAMADGYETRFPDAVQHTFAPFITAAHHGQWITVLIWIHAEVDESTIYVLRDGVLCTAIVPGDAYSITHPDWAAAGKESWNFGYLMGWANSGFAEQTSFVIDDVTMGDSPTVALTLGVNAGFVAAVPVNDPGGSPSIIDALAYGVHDTSPSYSARMVGMGWWCDNATEAANYELGLYDDAGADEPEARLVVSATNAKGTTTGWKSNTGFNYLLTPSTPYWITAQVDNTATATNTDAQTTGGTDFAAISAATLPADWGTSISKVDGAMVTIYAHVVPHIPPKAVLTRMRAA